MSQAALKANGKMYALVRKIDRNTRALAKLASAIEWVESAQEDASVLQVAMFDVVQQRRDLRMRLEDELKLAKGRDQ